MRFVVISLLVGLSTLLAACFPLSIRRNETPPIAFPEGRAGTVLALVMSEMYRQGAWARLSGSQGFNRLVHTPMFIAEPEFNALRERLTRYSTDILFVSYFLSDSWVEKYHERVVEICLIWPNGEVLALARSSPDKQWQREFRGVMSRDWREKWFSQYRRQNR